MIDIDESYQLTYTHDIHDTHDTHDIHDTHDTNTKVTFTDKLFEKLKKKRFIRVSKRDFFIFRRIRIF